MGVLGGRMALVARHSGMGATARRAPQRGLGVLGLLPPLPRQAAAEVARDQPEGTGCALAM